MNTKTLSLVLACSCVLGFFGCSTVSRKGSDTQASSYLEPQLSGRFSDIPVPAGLKLVAQESYSFESSGMRVALLKYKGKANPDQTVTFFKEQMPMYGWNLINAIEYGQRILNFDREQETCIMTLASKGNSVTLLISLGPKSQLPRKEKAPARPVK